MVMATEKSLHVGRGQKIIVLNIIHDHNPGFAARSTPSYIHLSHLTEVAYLEVSVLQPLVEVGASSIIGHERRDRIVRGQEILQLGTVVDMIDILIVPDFLDIGPVEGGIQTWTSVQYGQCLAEDSLCRRDASIWCADHLGSKIHPPVVVEGDGHVEFVPACASK